MNVLSAIFKGFYPYLAFFALLGIMLRIYRRQWTKYESVIIFVYLTSLFFTVVQCCFLGGHLSRRYLLTAVPLLWGWAAYALMELARIRILLLLIPVGAAFLLWDSFRTSLEYLWKPSKKIEVEALDVLVPVIQQDWQGEDFFDPGIWWDRYCAPERPVVQCVDFPFVGYRSGGRFFSPESPKKLQPDYIISENYNINEPYFVIWTGKIAGKCYIVSKYSQNKE